MNNQLNRLAKEAGFVFWEDEESVDWASNYDRELEKFADLVIRETVWKVYNHQTLYHQPNYKFDRLLKDIMEE